MDFIGPKARANLVHRAHHRTEVDRHTLCQSDHLTGGVEDRARAVGSLLDVGREGGAHQGCAHFFRGGQQVARNDFGTDRIHPLIHRAPPCLARARLCAY
jgi:hypothetical protein